MLEIIPPDTRFDFVGSRRWAFLASGLLILASVAVIATRGPRYGIDFTGGSLVHLRATRPVDLATIRAAFGDVDGGVAAQDVDARPGEVLLRFGPGRSSEADVRARLDRVLGSGTYEILRSELVGPRVGAELRRQALLAVVVATLVMGTYVAWRFEPRFGVGAALALLHDVVITIGALVAYNQEIDLTVIAALLTVVGYSVNDTVIVSDRLRENRRKYRRLDATALANLSINETLSRTVLTSGTALLVLISLYLLGGPVLEGFAFALLVGVTVGTYSSIFVAVPIALAVGGRRP
jgi:preprotein translocase subunit SecF